MIRPLDADRDCSALQLGMPNLLSGRLGYETLQLRATVTHDLPRTAVAVAIPADRS